MSTVAQITDGPEGMPASYVRNHGREERVAHGQIVARRGHAFVHVELCPGKTETPDTQWMCIVTDDRPGLLSLLTAGISAHALDIQNARIYCRPRRGRPDEAIDLFSVRDPKRRVPPLAAEKLRSISSTIESLISGELNVTALERCATPTARPRAPVPVSVRFDGSTDLLLVEAQDRPGLLLAISLSIFRERLTIVRSHVSTLVEHARDEFELAQTDGSRLTPAMRQLVIQRVRAALESESRDQTKSVPC